MAKRKCPTCGMELPEGGKEKLCPRCVVKEIMNETDGEMPEVSEDGEPAEPTQEVVQKSPTVAEVLAEKEGDRIGHYKLLQKLGDGGMGIVWMAEQTKPVRRLVALKVIKPGMDSKEVLARFEAERQALALMDHPNIAKVLDAGATPNGRPFFVMELVKGIPLIRFCDEQKLSIEERLHLFIPVCHAIQHAHQKGIIHRDIKPNNVLIALYDGKPVPKVIDFGIAKAMGQRLTEITLVTKFGSVLGTLEYMSPEQAELNQLDIDTRSDIYSLGVLLYELLTGTTPLTQDTLRKAAFDEKIRMIQEEEPPKPSVRLSTSRGQLPALSAQRKLEPDKLLKQVRGDLDWVVMMALDKDRERRYDTASAFAEDIQNYLDHKPVKARPPTMQYRLKKFVRRHRTGVVVAGGFVLFLCVALASAISLLIIIEQQKDALETAYRKLKEFSNAVSKRTEQELNRLWPEHRDSMRISSLQLEALWLPQLSRQEFQEYFPRKNRGASSTNRTFTVGVYVHDNPVEEARSYAPLLKCLERDMTKFLGDEPVKFDLILYRTYEHGRDDLVNRRVDFFRTGAWNYLQAQQKDPKIQGIVEPVIRGKIAVFFTRTNSGIQALTNIIGKRVAFGDTNSTITSIAQYILATNNITGTNLAYYEFLDSYAKFDETGHIPDYEGRLHSHVEVILGVLSNRFDVGVARIDYVKTFSQIVPIPGTEFECTRSLWMARGGADPAVANAFSNTMLSLPRYSWLESKYRPVTTATHKAEINLAKFIEWCFPIKGPRNRLAAEPTAITPKESQP